MLNLSHLSAFLAVVDTASFHGAAAKLGVSQSTVSHALKRLEETVGVQLILRRRDGCALTRHGEIFLPFARSLLALTERSLARLAADRVRIGASSNVGIYLLQPHLKRLADAGLAEADIFIATNPEIAEKLETREIDLGFMEWWDDRPGFAATRWRTDRLVVIAAPNHPWAKLNAVTVDMLCAEPFLGGERGTGTGTLLRGALGPEADRIVMAQQLGSTEAVKRAVAAGLGVSIVLESAILDDVAAGRLAAIAVERVTLEKTLWAVHQADLEPVSRAMQALAVLRGGDRPSLGASSG